MLHVLAVLVFIGVDEDQILVEMSFSTPIQTDPGAYTASYVVGTKYFPGVKWPGRGIGHPPPPSAEVKERVELYFYSPYGRSWPFLR
jgi:hypothetical protein